MLDRRLRPAKERLLEPVARPLGGYASANAITAVALVVTLIAAALAASERPGPALGAWLLGRLLDGLDGPVARHRGEASELGGYLDMVVDTIGYAAVPIGVAFGVGDRNTWIAAAFLLGSFSVNTISWTYLSALLEKRGAGADTTGEMTSITMPPALVEGTETIVVYSLFLAFSELATSLFALMAVAVGINVIQRLTWARHELT